MLVCVGTVCLFAVTSGVAPVLYAFSAETRQVASGCARESGTGTAETPAIAGIPTFKVPADLVFRRHAVGDAAGKAVVAGGEGVIFSNTKGLFAAAPPPGVLMADDIATTAQVGCRLTRYTFDVTGKADPAGEGGPYSVEFALYDICPNALSSTGRLEHIIPGTLGSASFPDEVPRTVEVIVPGSVSIPTNLWLGVSFTRRNSGVVVGAPALVGFSGDVLDYPGFECNAYLGGFPDFPHASFNAELFGEACAPGNVAYKASRVTGVPFNPGRNRWFADDLNLVTEDCAIIHYEVAVKGAALYEFELRYSCAGSAIPGTERSRIVSSGSDVPRILSFTIDPPVPLPRSPWYAMKISNDTGGTIVTGGQADVGWTEDAYALELPGDTCDFRTVGEGIHAAFHVSITCEGPASTGACCDMYVTECAGGTNEGKACRENDDCAEPGTCESVCREVPKVNCPFPPPGIELRPEWIEGAVCEPGPFVEGTCGDAACCYTDAGNDDRCTNLTENECYSIPPLENDRQWQQGRFCSLDGQHCPLDCKVWEMGSCFEPHDTPGCCPINCALAVCATLPDGPFCCAFMWDQLCVQLADELCRDFIPPTNDECIGTEPGERAVLIAIPSIITTNHRNATESDSDSAFCCHIDGPETKGLGTVWYKFEATETSAELSTCLTSGSTVDSLLQVFAAGDPTSYETACNSLSPIGCSDDVEGCASTGLNGRLCLVNLVPGDMYYVMVAAKTPEAQDNSYKLDITAPCEESVDDKPGDHDFDGDVDLHDFADFQRCFTGPGAILDGDCCGLFDLDSRDGDIDDDDFARFRDLLDGP